MLWLYLIALALIGVIVVILIGRWNGAHAPEEESSRAGGDVVDQLLAERAEEPFSAEDLETITFDPAVRGYRMEQVDKLLDALAAQLRESRTGQGAELESE